MEAEREQALVRQMEALLGGECPSNAAWLDSREVYAWRLMRLEADMPLTGEGREALLASVAEAMQPLGVAAARAADEEDALLILLCETRFPARIHRDATLWLCAHALMENASVALEQESTAFIGEEFDAPEDWQQHQAAMREVSDWWQSVSPIAAPAARAHRTQLQTIIKRRQYTALAGYVSRALRQENEPGAACFAFVPLVIEAVWSQHAEISLRALTHGLSLTAMTRRPREALLSWLGALPDTLRACPAPMNAAPIERVIASIRADCSLPYSQANLSRSLGLTPAYFCRLFHEKTGQHFSSFLARTRMEKAQELLSAPEPPPLQELAAVCGYPNKSYFCQVFRKYTGLTPAEFEQKRRGEPADA